MSDTAAPSLLQSVQVTDLLPQLSDPRLFINRELSWLAFNERVLDQTRRDGHPLLERVKFLAIAANNLDEFFMIRVATLTRQFRAGVRTVSPDGLPIERQLMAVRARAERVLSDISTCWETTLRPRLAEAGIHLVEPGDYTDDTREFLRDYFSANVFPVLTPLAFDPGHPFPYISNRSKNFAVAILDGGIKQFARVKVPDTLPRFIPIPARRGSSEQSFAFLEDVIRQGLPELFPGVTVQGAHLFRIIRDTDIVLREEEAEDLLETVDAGLKALRQGPITLLQTEEAMPDRLLDLLIENFELVEQVVVPTSTRLGVADWMALTRLPRPDLKDSPIVPRVVWRAETPDAIFAHIADRDRLVHHPFDSFSAVETFVKAAVDDPQVAAIKMTLYRIGENSPLIDQLIHAAEQGKQVAVLVELKARFDERSNIAWASRMEDAGVHVVYGLMNLKTHCKLCLVVRKEGARVRRYVHIGTGNYNRATAQVYTDFGLFTADDDIAADASDVFNYLTGYSRQTEFRSLLVAPMALRRRFEALVEREIAHAREGRPAGIVIKNNAIADPEIVRLLYRASQAGVHVDAIVRGICCLTPGVPGISERIQVRSIVGRFLEHSRMYVFTNGGHGEMYIGSADLMERNLDRRVEVLCPVHDREIRQYLDSVLNAYLRDDTRASVLTANGTYERVAAGIEKAFDAQHALTDESRPSWETDAL